MRGAKGVLQFGDVFSGAAAQITTDAPGRVNLIGEHTDYNGGFVLPSAIPQRTQVQLTPTDGARVRAASADTDAGKPETYELGHESPRKNWIDYIQGVTQVLAREGFRIGGFDALISSRVPIGSGLSSSAALEVALLRALREAFRLDLDDVRIARIGQRVENDFVGAQVGIMDQMASSLAREGEALFLDTLEMSFRRVVLPADKLELLVIHSGVTHAHSDGDYNQRRRECEEAGKLLGVDLLRHVKPAALEGARTRLPDVLYRRVRHVMTEDARVLETVAALERGDPAAVGRLFNESHLSMRDDYEVSAPPVDTLVAITQAEAGVFGARMTGGGFGGSIVALCRPGTAQATGERVREAYGKRTGNEAEVLVPESRADA